MNFFADGQELRLEREKKGLSLADLARLSGVSKGSIGNFETNIRGLGNKSKMKIWTVLQTDNHQNADDKDADCQKCAALESRIVELVSERDFLRKELSAAHRSLEAALATKPSAAAAHACVAADGVRKARREA